MFSANLVLRYFYLPFTLLFLLPLKKLFSGLLSVSLMELKDLLEWNRNNRPFSNNFSPLYFHKYFFLEFFMDELI